MSNPIYKREGDRPIDVKVPLTTPADQINDSGSPRLQTLADLANAAVGVQHTHSVPDVLMLWSVVANRLYELVAQELANLPGGSTNCEIFQIINRHPINVMFAEKVMVLTYGRTFFDFGAGQSAREWCQNTLRAEGSGYDDPGTRAGV